MLGFGSYIEIEGADKVDRFIVKVHTYIVKRSQIAIQDSAQVETALVVTA